jgi:CBS domain-containing protein
MQSTKVKSVMTENPAIISPDTSLKQAAASMDALNCGVLPVGKEGKLEGIITDRDIVIRAVSQGKDVNAEIVRDYMTPELFYCKAEDGLDHAAALMHQYQVNRLLVQGEDGRVCGIISFGCILRKDNDPGEISDIVECALGRKAA